MTTTEMESRLSAVERDLAQIKAQIAAKNGAPLDDRITQEFASLSQQWHRDTLIQSDPSAILTHAAYYRIIGMGPPVLPCIFRDLQAGGGHWFLALEAITGANPVPPEHQRSVSLMRQDWLLWGKSRGLVHE